LDGSGRYTGASANLTKMQWRALLHGFVHNSQH
jgi:hypothetical protein